MFRSQWLITKVLPTVCLGAGVVVFIGGCASAPSTPSRYGLTGTNSPTAFVPPASTIDSKGHYHPDWYFHGAPRQVSAGQGQ